MIPTTFPIIKEPMQLYDDAMRQEEADDERTFNVERRAHFAEVIDAFLNPADITAMFGPACDGTTLQFDVPVSRNTVYGAWADPALRFNVSNPIENYDRPGQAMVAFERSISATTELHDATESPPP